MTLSPIISLWSLHPNLLGASPDHPYWPCSELWHQMFGIRSSDPWENNAELVTWPLFAWLQGSSPMSTVTFLSVLSDPTGTQSETHVLLIHCVTVRLLTKKQPLSPFPLWTLMGSFKVWLIQKAAMNGESIWRPTVVWLSASISWSVHFFCSDSTISV